MKKSKVIYAAILALLVVFASAMVIAFAVLSGNGEDPESSLKLYDVAAWVAYALLIAALVMVVTFPVLRIVQNFKTYLRTLIGIAGVTVIFLICYALSPAASGEFYTSHEIGPKLSRFINAGLITTYITMVATIVIFVYTEISGRVK